MVKKEMRAVLDNVRFQDPSEENRKLSVPGITHAWIVIETINKASMSIQLYQRQPTLVIDDPR